MHDIDSSFARRPETAIEGFLDAPEHKSRQQGYNQAKSQNSTNRDSSKNKFLSALAKGRQDRLGDGQRTQTEQLEESAQRASGFGHPSIVGRQMGPGGFGAGSLR